MVERLSKKANDHDFGFLRKEIADIRISLDPLIENKLFLK